MPPPATRHIDELLLAAGDVAVVDRATLSLWHIQQLLRPHLTPAQAPLEADDKENAATNQDAAALVAAPAPTTVELEDGMTVAAVAFAEPTDGENDPHETMAATTTEPELPVAVPPSGGNEAASIVRTWRMRRASITESEISVDDDAEPLATFLPQAHVSMATQVALVYRRYRCVLCLDASPSALAIDVHSGKVFLEMLYDSVDLFVRNLLRPVEVGGTPFVPEFHVSVMVQGAYVESLCVLVQGFVLDLSNADRLLQLVRERLALLEDEWAAATRSDHRLSEASKQRASLSSVLQNAVFALHSLPSGAAPLIVLATDGVVDLHDAYTYDSLVMQLVRHDIQCHFLRIGGSPWQDPHASFGFVPDIELLDFLAQASSGSVIEYISLHQSWAAPPARDRVKCMTPLQSSLLVRPSKVQAISAPVLKLDMAWCASFDGNQYMPLRPYRMWREKVHEYRIQTDVHHIVEARVREGFAVNKVHVRTMQRLADGSFVNMPVAPLPIESVPSHGSGTKILLVFVLQWKQNVWLEYVISTTIDHQSQGRTPASSRSTTKTVSGSASVHPSSSKDKKDPAASEWYVKVNVLADAEFLRAFADCRANRQGRQDNAEAAGSPTALHDFIRNVQDVDRVLLHLMTAAASAISATDTPSHFSFGSQANTMVSPAASKNQSSHPVFGIIGELSPVLWHRWFHVDRFEVLAVVVDDPSPQSFYPRGVAPQVVPRNSAMGPLRSLPTARLRQGRRAGVSLEANAHPLLMGKDFTVERIRGAILRWSSQRLGKDLFLRFLSTDSQRAEERSKPMAATPTSSLPKRRQQRSSLNSATLAAQINASMEQMQLQPRREERSKGALCFVRVEAKNHTLVVIHVAFFAASASTRRETLVELKSIVGTNDAQPSTSQGTTGGMMLPPTSSSNASRKLVLVHRLLSRLLVTHETLALQDTDNVPESFFDQDKPMVACCGGSELRLRSVFGAFMWHSSWKWRLTRTSTTSLVDVMRHLHEARIRAGFWVLDWTMEEDGESMRIASVIFGREILMEDENGHLKTSLIQYGITRTADNCLLTSFWMEPQYGFAKTTVARDATTPGQHDVFHSSLRHAVGHDAPLSKLAAGSLQIPTADGSAEGASTYLDEGKLLGLIRDFLFDADRHLLSCLHTFETVTGVQESGVDSVAQRYAIPRAPGVIGLPTEDETLQGSSSLVPAFSTARLLEASTRSSEHFLMYLERSVSLSLEANETAAIPALSSANIYLYSMLERTLRSLSDCEVAWTDFDGCVVGDTLERTTDSRMPTIASQLPLWFARFDSVMPESADRQLSLGRCFAKLLPNDTVVFSFLPAISTLARKRRPMLSPIETTDKTISKRQAGLARWDQRHQLKTAASAEVTEQQAAAAQSSMLKMSVSADDIVLYQERRQSFREGYKSWRMGHFQGSKDDKTHRAGHGGQLSPHPKVASFSEDYEFCESICRDAALGGDFHLLIEKADGELGSGYFQVAFYECSLAQLTATLTTQPCYGQREAREALLTQLFAHRAVGEPAVESDRTPQLTKRGATSTFGSRAGLGIPPPSPISIPVEPARDESPQVLAVLHSSMTFRKKVKRAHEHNFSRGIYVALRDGAPVEQSDLIQALSSCVEVPLDLDITLLYRMLQVDMIRETVPRSALRSSMIDMLSGKPIRDALKERLDKSLEDILSAVFHGIADTKYFVFVGSENLAVDDVAGGGADTEGDTVQLLEEEDLIGENEGMPSKPPRLVKSITIASDSGGFGPLAAHGDGGDYERVASSENITLEFGGMSASIEAGESALHDLVDHQHQQQINQEEDAELNKDVAAATSSFSSPFFFRFECRELVKDLAPGTRPRSTSSGMNSFELRALPPKSIVPRSASTMGNSGSRTSQGAVTLLQNKSTDSSSTDGTDGAVKGGPTGGVSEIAEWAAKLSGPKIALRLVTLTLPNEQLLKRTRGSHMGVEVEDQRQKVTPAELFSSLPLFQRHVLKRLRKRIKEWSSMEILRILRNVESITPEISQLVQKLFRALPDDCRTTVKYPISFVDVQHETVDPLALLEQELRLGTDSLQLIDGGGPYFVVNRLSEASYTVPYWAFLTVEKDHIVLQLHHQPADGVQGMVAPFDRLTVLTSLHLAVNGVCKRVNQFLLLLQLHETRSCNELLLPADPGTASAGPPSPTLASQQRLSDSSPRPFFWPGQFECDRKYAAFFRLHERMTPSIALTTLCTQALEQFEVHNRRHVFVYRDRGGHVFYMKMSVATSDALSQPATPSNLRRSTGSSAGDSSITVPSGILLEVFGVSTAGEEVTQELCRLLERKLDEIMQLILMKLLARNTKFQLSSSDLAFMCPPDSSPASSIVYKMPSGLVPRSDASTTLLFLCQTLGMTAYIRQLNTSPQSQLTQAMVQGRYERQSSTRSATNGRGGVQAETANTEPASDVQPIDVETGRLTVVNDASVFHPALFGQEEKLSSGFVESISSSDATTTSPVFFSRSSGGVKQPPSDQETIVAPVVLGHATFAVNLNSELRLSPGFLSRVGKGLAILRVEFLHCEDGNMVVEDGSEMTSLDVGHTFRAVSSDTVVDNLSTLFVRCQLWVRGPIQVPAFRSVYEAHLRESICDYAIEATIRHVRRKPALVDDEGEKTANTKMPQPVGVLVDLLEASAQMSSTSVTKLSLPVAIQSWDVANIVSQVHKFLTASLPVHARPAIFSGAHGSVFVRVDGTNELRSQSHDHVKLIPTPPTVDYGTASSSTLAKSDSIQSEMSDMDSVSSFRYSIGSSTIESLSSTSIHTGSASSLVSIKEFTTSELMFHSMAKGAGAETAKRSAPPVVQQRSFYYLISVSVTDGLVFHGYNLSQQVVDAIAMQFARVMTWCLLRDRMLQGLLLQRGGVGYAAPSGASVVQPRLLLSNGGALHATEFSLSYVAFQTTMVPILQAFDLLPKSVETTTYRLDLTPFGKLLKELGVQIVDKSDLQRTRSRNLAPSRPASDDATSSTGRMPGAMRSGILSSSSSQRTMGGAGIEKTPPPRPGTGTTVASPTKRGSTGGLLAPALSIGPSSGSGQQARSGGPGGSNAANAARMQRSNPTAANALMAARARARGGGFPGKMGGGPGVGSSRAAGEVAPWDLPVTNTKVNTTASSVGHGNPPRQPDASAGRSTTSAIPPTPVLGRVGSNGAGTVGVPKRPSGSQATLGAMGATAGRPAFDRKGGTKANAWRSILVETWGPHAKYYCRNEKTTCKEPTEETSRGRTIDPLRHYGAAFQHQLQLTTASSAASDGSMALFRLIQETPIDVASLDVADDKHLQTMLQTGHVMFHQRFRVSFIERWQIVKIDDEYVEDGSNTGRLRALQASMDLVNLLSYKQEFVFGGNERVVAKLLTEHTVQAMCGKEGQAVREMKLQILKAVFHSRMDVVHRFFEQYATHLRSLGFLHLQLASSRLARKQQVSSSSATTTPTATAAGSGSGSGSGSATPSRSSVDAFASGDEAFSEFFVHRGGMVTKATKSGVRGASSTPAQKDLLVLELKCDHTGVQVSVVLLNDQDLKQQQLGHQRHLDRTQNEVTTTPGEVVRQVSKSLRDTLDTRMLIHDFTIRFFHRCLLDWTLNKPGTTSSLHNMVRGVRCFLRSYPRSPSEKAKSDCALEAATVELPVRNLQSDFSESILVKILLRYIACHGSRYDVTDLTQFGTPDTIACHSAAGNFFSRQNAGGVLSSSSASVSSSWNRGGTASPPGYSLLITTQELWKGQKRPKNSVLLALVRSAPSSAILLRTDRAMQEAELYVKELFRAAAANYERDLLWSRLLHNDSQGPSADVAHALALPVEYFRVEVGPQQLEECLRLSVCIPLQQIDPELNELLEMEDVCWQEFALRLRDVYAGQVREYQFEGQAACHFLLLCPDARDLMIHLTFPSGISSATMEGDAANRVQIAICRREEPANHKFTLPQRRAITDFVNSVVHWLWRCLLYD